MSELEKIKDLYDHNVRKVKVTYSHGGEEVIRLFKSTYGEICRFKKGSSRKGYPLTSNIIKVEEIIVKKRKTDEQKWIDSLNKIKDKLIKSGLWESLVKEIDIALDIGYDNMQSLYSKNNQLNYEEFTQYAKENYPQLIKINDKNEEYADHSLVWHWHSIPKVEKMRFSKYASTNEHTLKLIAEKMQAKESYSTWGEYQYDISFEYNAEKKRAWYSKEYKGCGNGYYYLAINETHAMFGEKD